ncbi:MAG TPA: Blp family class II bacteriocin [Enterococcus columbae]|nr:Blp family class II bacteriocin [Enterococcus columbae]
MLDSKELESIYGGTNWTKCYAGTIGSAILGFGAMGPIGYWAGAGVGYASFC